MSLTVTVVDNETGQTETAEVPDADYLLIVTAPAYVASTQTFLNGGTHILTIKGRRDRPGMAGTVRYEPPTAVPS